VVSEGFKVPVSGEVNYGTRMMGVYRTSTIPGLDSYGVAQFIRGCVYTSSVKDGKFVKVLDVNRQFYGRVVPYHHPAWVIDGVVRDPLDWGYDAPSPTRHYYYQWNQDPDSLDLNTAQYVGEKPPAHPVIFVSDHPGTAFWDPDTKSARNISLQFKTCIYRSQDVPTDVPEDELDFARPLSCFTWKSSFIYNHVLNRFESPEGLDPLCLTPLAPAPSAP
jgi:hypothetical protein